jgi:hypothetical protein
MGKLLQDIPRRLCQDKRQRLSLRSHVRLGQSYYKELKNNELEKQIA